MNGPQSIVAALSGANVTDRDGRKWQYHSRSDHHSRIACIAILTDLLVASPLLRRHAENGTVGFGLNHEMRDFRLARKKDLDFVVCRPASGGFRKRTLSDLARAAAMPAGASSSLLRECDVGAVLVALEAKACMTAHIKALPRLYDELNSSHQTVHGAAQEALAAGFCMINAADTFISPPGLANTHRQPKDTERTLQKVRELPRRSKAEDDGYDALGIVVVDCKNDGSPVSLVTSVPAPQPNDVDHYDRMIDRLATLYASRFKEL